MDPYADMQNVNEINMFPPDPSVALGLGATPPAAESPSSSQPRRPPPSPATGRGGGAKSGFVHFSSSPPPPLHFKPNLGRGSTGAARR